jgi:hypothetical protein
MLFLLTITSILVLGASQHPVRLGGLARILCFLLKTRWPTREVPSSAKIKNARSFTYMFTVHSRSMTFVLLQASGS